MNYVNTPNLLIEALAYLGRSANGSTWGQMEERIRQRGIQPSPIFSETLDRLKALTERLDARQPLKDADTQALFQNLDGFPRNTVGTASPAFLIFYGLLERFSGDLSDLDVYVSVLQPDQITYHIALALDLADDYPSGQIPNSVFLDLVLSLSIPDGSKISILNVCRDFHPLFRKMLPAVTAVLDCLHREKPALDALCQVLDQKIRTEGADAYLSRTSRLVPAEGMEYQLRPFLFGMDTGLTSQLLSGDTCVYCGILREELLDMLSGQVSPRDSVYEAFRLLGDRTRFDLICYLRDHVAYGQELSAKFGLSRNTIHHHMSKLSATGLVRCTTNGNRVYYSLDEDMVRRLLRQQEELFCCRDKEQ